MWSGGGTVARRIESIDFREAGRSIQPKVKNEKRDTETRWFRKRNQAKQGAWWMRTSQATENRKRRKKMIVRRRWKSVKGQGQTKKVRHYDCYFLLGFIPLMIGIIYE